MTSSSSLLGVLLLVLCFSICLNVSVLCQEIEFESGFGAEVATDFTEQSEGTIPYSGKK